MVPVGAGALGVEDGALGDCEPELDGVCAWLEIGSGADCVTAFTVAVLVGTIVVALVTGEEPEGAGAGELWTVAVGFGAGWGFE